MRVLSPLDSTSLYIDLGKVRIAKGSGWRWHADFIGIPALRIRNDEL